jgi:hypothetical protein
MNVAFQNTKIIFHSFQLFQGTNNSTGIQIFQTFMACIDQLSVIWVLTPCMLAGVNSVMHYESEPPG